MKFAKELSSISEEMVYVAICYHDVGVSIDRRNYEKVSADLLRRDDKLKGFFDEEKIEIMAEAIEDHRASMKGDPRSIYGRILSSADRNVDVDDALRRTYFYRIKHFPNYSLDELIEDSRMHLIEKFGKNGYAQGKIYFEDCEYQKFLEDIRYLTNDSVAFTLKYKQVNHLK